MKILKIAMISRQHDSWVVEVSTQGCWPMKKIKTRAVAVRKYPYTAGYDSARWMDSGETLPIGNCRVVEAFITSGLDELETYKLGWDGA